MTVTEIIQEALEQLGVLAAGETVSAQDQATCLTSFKSMIKALPGFGIGGGLDDVVVTTSPYDAKVNERIRWDGVGALTVNLPTLVDELPPRSGDRVAVVNGAGAGVFVYITSKGSWLSVDAITGASDDPLGPDCDQPLSDMLAYRVARKFGVQISGEMASAKDIAERAINARFAPDMTANLDPALWSYWDNWNGAQA
jgi:hypothetical protein